MHRLASALTAGFALVLPCILCEGARTGALAQSLAGVSIILLGFHACLTLGAARTAVFLSLCLIIAFTVENIAVATGVPFGRYAFRLGRDWPHVGAVPIIVGPIYFGFGYQAWIIACLLVGADVSGPRDRLSRVAVPLVAAIAITQWDLVIDPPSATIGRAWIWLDGGRYFGVPLSNFLGWLLTTWVIFQLFTLCTGLLPAGRNRGIRCPFFVALPILVYMASGLCHLVPLFDPDGAVPDGAGRIWSAADIRTNAAVTALFTMIPMSCLALIQLARSRVRDRLHVQRPGVAPMKGRGVLPVR